MVIFDLIYKEEEDRNGKARWSRVEVLIEKEDDKLISLP